MSALRPGAIAAILRKDFQTLWPLVLTALLLPLCVATDASLELAAQAKQLLMMVGGLAMAALTMVVIQQDGPANQRLDILTRPVSLTSLLTAKIVFLALSLALPMFVSSVLQQHFLQHSWSEALLVAASGLLEMVVLVAPVLVLALVTTNLIEAGIAVFGLVIITVIVRLLFRHEGDRGGAEWVVDLVTYAAAFAFCAAALMLLFRRKNPLAARCAWVAGALVVMLATHFFPLGAALAVQQAISPRSVWKDKLALAVSTHCDEKTGQPRTEIAPQNLPDGWRMHLDQIATGPEPMEWGFAVTLLRPAVSRELLANGRRRYLPGVGYCEATMSHGVAYVGCFKPFARPAAFSASIKGDPSRPCLNCDAVDYRPAFMEGFGGRMHTIAQRPNSLEELSDQPVVTVTTYDAVAHFSRRAIIAAPSAKGTAACRRDLAK